MKCILKDISDLNLFLDTVTSLPREWVTKLECMRVRGNRFVMT